MFVITFFIEYGGKINLWVKVGIHVVKIYITLFRRGIIITTVILFHLPLLIWSHRLMSQLHWILYFGCFGVVWLSTLGSCFLCQMKISWLTLNQSVWYPLITSASNCFSLLCLIQSWHHSYQLPYSHKIENCSFLWPWNWWLSFASKNGQAEKPWNC